MQIISGKFRGKRLSWVSNQTTRPTTSRVKENIFNVLSSIRGKTDFEGDAVLCLFSGSGQMGLECVSRGASDVVFNDRDVEAVSVIKKNCASVGHVPVLYNLDYMECLKKLSKKKFDLVLLDPPFADIDIPSRVSKYLRENEMLAKNAVIIAETETPDLVFEGFNVKTKTYGRAVIYFVTQN